MSRTDVKVVLDQRAINSMLVDTTDLSAARAAGRVRDRARINAPGSGDLTRSINYRKVSQTSTVAVYSVGSDLFYAPYQEFGTGPIYPVRAKILRFVPAGSATYVFAKRTSGVPATHFLGRAYSSVSLRDFLP
jgi:Bacteriophage HK97-gp10, putative tail-component